VLKLLLSTGKIAPECLRVVLGLSSISASANHSHMLRLSQPYVQDVDPAAVEEAEDPSGSRVSEGDGSPSELGSHCSGHYRAVVTL